MCYMCGRNVKLRTAARLEAESFAGVDQSRECLQRRWKCNVINFAFIDIAVDAAFTITATAFRNV